MARDFYDVLGVKRDATDDDIKRSYRKLVREYHPDRNPGDKQAETRFKEVQEAFDVLSDTSKRTQYDRFGSVGGPGSNGEPGGFQWGGGGEGVQIDPSQLGDLFNQFGGAGGLGDLFGQRTRRRGQPTAPREPVTHELRVPFKTAALGGKISLSINDRSVDVTIPAGVNQGQTLRVQGQGPGGADLLLKLRIDAHPHFRREGNDLIIATPVSVSEAILGAKVDVPTIDGAKLTVTIRPGASSGNRLRLRGKGVKGGDQYVEIKVIVPSKIDDASRKLIEEFAALNPQNPRAGPPWE